jgi:hypothetical protein
MKRLPLNWDNTKGTGGIRYMCGYCGTDTAPANGYYTGRDNTGHQGYVLLCTNCNYPTFIDVVNDKITSTTPAAKMGKEVDGLSPKVEKLYDEARLCTSAGAYTAGVLTCRKILMHVAVEKGAPSNKGFIEYVEYLADKNYIPHDGRDWVDYIRTKSNEANHEIQVMGAEDAEDLITFTEMLLRLVYEFKNRLLKKKATTP